MSDFVQTMKEWQRICDSMQGGIRKCDNCPLFKVLCQYTPNEKVDFAGAEQIIKKWAEEHPVVYPTWTEWLVDSGVFPQKMSTIPSIAFNTIRDSLSVEIPADIAEKLGIEPKEGV